MHKDFSLMSADELRALARDLANPKEAMRRIRKERREQEAAQSAE